jgi:hypothetical protein
MGSTIVLICVLQLGGLFYFFSMMSSTSIRLFSDRSSRSRSNEYDFFNHKNDNHLPVLIIGGSDGSGTRAFVDTLKQLGVTIVADDPDTFDVHAAEIFQKKGWPALVNTVLEQTHSGNYDWDDLPKDTQQVLEREVKRFLKGLSAKYERQQQRQADAADGGPRSWSRWRLSSRPNNPPNMAPPAAGATKVAFAIKAPVAMLVLPVLAQFMGPLKFVHVLRE